MCDDEQPVPPAEDRDDSEVRNDKNAWVGYVVPMALFMVLTAVVEPQLRQHYVWVYIAKVILVTGALVAFRGPLREIRPDARMGLLGAALGVALCALWIGMEKYVPYPHFDFLGKRAEFNPYKEIGDHTQRMLFIGARLFGLTVTVALMEEIFWRAFLLRYLTSPEWQKVALGAFSMGALAGMAALFGAAHPEWLSAVIFAVAMALLLRHTRSLFACVVAHGVTNLTLGLYVLTTGEWRFW